MKLFRKVLSAVAVLALVAAAIPANAKAASNVLDFEDGKLPAAVDLAKNSDGTIDGDPANLSVVDFEGSKRLRIEPTQSGIPKVKFNVTLLVGEENIGKVKGIQYDLVIEKPDDTTTTWNGGTVGGANAGINGAWVQGVEWTLQDDTKNISDPTPLKTTLNADFGFTNPDDAFFMFMNWANNGAINYIDNVQLLDADGNPLPLSGLDAAPAADTAAATTAPKTGVQSYAIVFGIGAIAMLGGAVIFRKRRTIEA